MGKLKELLNLNIGQTAGLSSAIGRTHKQPQLSVARGAGESGPADSDLDSDDEREKERRKARKVRRKERDQRKKSQEEDQARSRYTPHHTRLVCPFHSIPFHSIHPFHPSVSVSLSVSLACLPQAAC